MAESAEKVRSRIRREADRIWPDVVRWRRRIHEHPELAWEEHETANLVHQVLTEIGIPTETGIARTGVVGTLATDIPGPAIVLRADMDALPVQESTGLPFASRHSGRMHACGHDVHTASLLGTAAILASIRSLLRGSVRFVFQPAEERIPGGAAAMIDEGVLDGFSDATAPVAFAQHVFPDRPAGSIGVCPGVFMASADEIYITVDAEGGHAAMPHQIEADAVLVASHIIVALQSVISRNCPPEVPSVLSFGRLVADGATNLLVDRAKIEGTLRAMNESWRYKAHDLIKRVAAHTAKAYGASATVDIRVGYPALLNDVELAHKVRRAASEYVGEQLVYEEKQWFASEDFAYFLQQINGVLYTIGVGHTTALHSSQFNPDESSLRTGSGFMAYLAWRHLKV